MTETPQAQSPGPVIDVRPRRIIGPPEPHPKLVYDAYLSASNGKTLMFSNQGYENREECEHMVLKHFAGIPLLVNVQNADGTLSHSHDLNALDQYQRGHLVAAAIAEHYAEEFADQMSEDAQKHLRTFAEGLRNGVDLMQTFREGTPTKEAMDALLSGTALLEEGQADGEG